MSDYNRKIRTMIFDTLHTMITTKLMMLTSVLNFDHLKKKIRLSNLYQNNEFIFHWHLTYIKGIIHIQILCSIFVEWSCTKTFRFNSEQDILNWMLTESPLTNRDLSKYFQSTVNDTPMINMIYCRYVETVTANPIMIVNQYLHIFCDTYIFIFNCFLWTDVKVESERWWLDTQEKDSYFWIINQYFWKKRASI